MKILQIGCNNGNDHLFKYIEANHNNVSKLLLIDCNSKALELCKKQYSNYSFCEFLCRAIVDVGNLNSKQVVYLPENDDVSEHCSVFKDHLIEHQHKNIRQMEVDAININDLLEQNKLHQLDRLYIDTEGLDAMILNSLDLNRFDIDYICFEYVHSDGAHSHGGVNLDACIKKLQNNGYNLQRDGYNLIATKKHTPKIYDCFLYNGESDILNLRLHELNDVVHKFIIVEGAFNFKGESKQLKFKLDDFSSFKDKIIYKVCDTLPQPNAWINEKNQRNFLKEGFRGLVLYENDIILISDVDEIPDALEIKNLKSLNFKGVKTFYSNYYYYNTQCLKESKWPGTVIVDAAHFTNKYAFSFEEIRKQRHNFELIGKDGDYTSGGWHFSYFGGVQNIIEKIKSFSHQEYNNETYTNPEQIQKLINNKSDLFFRNDKNEQFLEDSKLPANTYLPRHVDLLNLI
jgi:beta-1,4-mannosyl-glycoprotein beta-1,4-N-acetylglucosaminyltransferase